MSVFSSYFPNLTTFHIMRKYYFLLTFMAIALVSFGQKGTFIALDNNKSLYSLDVNGCNKTPLNFCTNFAGNPLSIGLFGNILYVNDNKGNLYRNTLDANGTVGNCTKVGTFLSKSSAIYGLTVGSNGVVYAASSNLIETYNPSTNTFGTLGYLPSNFSIGGDLLFYQGQLFEVCNNNNASGENDLVKVDELNPSLSTIYMKFTNYNNSSIFGFASVTIPCSKNQLFAVAQDGNLYNVDMENKTQSTIPICNFGIRINDAASIAETESTPPPNPPITVSPVNYCVNTIATQLKAVSGANDTLKWYSKAIGSTTILPPTPFVGSTSSSDTFYVSQMDTITKCESDRIPVIVKVDTFSNPSISISPKATNNCANGLVTYNAIVTDGGNKPNYQWTLNGKNVGNDSVGYTCDSLKNKDQIACTLTSNLFCAVNPKVTSNIIVYDTTIKPQPSISISASENSICTNANVTYTAVSIDGGSVPNYQWRINNVSVGNDSVNFTTNKISNGDIVTCTLTSSLACAANKVVKSSPITMTIINPPFVDNIVGINEVCQGKKITMTNITTNGIWQSNNTNFAIIDSLTGIVTGINAGRVVISYEKFNKCGSTIKTFELLVIDSVKLFPIIGQSALCIDETIQFTEAAKGGLWSSSNILVASINAITGNVTGLSNGNTTIRYDVSNSCGIVSVIKPLYIAGVSVFNKSFFIKQPTCQLPLSGSIKVSLNGPESPYKFYLNGQMYDDFQEATRLGEGNYTVYIYNNIGCLVDSIKNILLSNNIDASCDTFYIPTGFVPESKYQENRTLKPFGGTSTIEAYSFKVYNRWGNLVFESHNLNVGWDGTVYGKLATTDTYVWYLEYKFANKSPHKIKGTSVLIR